MQFFTSVTPMAVAQNWPGFGVIIAGELSSGMETNKNTIPMADTSYI